MEPLGVFSSAGTAVELCNNLLSLCKDVKNAGTEIYQLQRLVANLQNVLSGIEQLRDSRNSEKLKNIHQLTDATHEARSLLQKLIADLCPEKSHKIWHKITRRSLKWPFAKQDIQQRMSNLEKYIQIINEGLQIDQTVILLDMDYKAVIDRLPVANSAYFDSFDESRNSKCLEDTRVHLLQDIFRWATDPNSQVIFWLNGMAGTGKSTISRTVSETLANKNRLGASFFFKRGEADRGGLAKLFTTITADLAKRHPAFAPHVKEAMDVDPGIFAKSALEQFNKLTIEPLSKIPQDSAVQSPIVVVIDALDECDRDKDIELLIWLLSRSTQPTFPKLKFFLTSRPELPLRLGFKKVEGRYQGLILHEVQAPVIESDIAKYFRHELSSARHDYNLSRSEGLKLPTGWPGDDNIKILVRMAAPLFIFASTTCRFIADRKYGDPQRQLERVLEYETKAQGSRLDATYLPVLEQQIDGLSDREKYEVVEEFRDIIGAIIVLENPLSTAALSRMLETPINIISNRLEMLHSVLSVPSALDTPVRLLHLSFRDFLLDPDKRDKIAWWVDERQAHSKLVGHCLRVLDNLKSDMCDLRAPGTPRSDITSEAVDAHLASEVQYSCLYLVSHVQQSQMELIDDGPVGKFIFCHFLHWLEALCLIGRIWDSIEFVNVLQTLLKPQSSIQLSTFLSDAKKFILAHVSTIETWPLQIYSSALAFTPMESVVRAHFEDARPSWLAFLPSVAPKWDSRLQVLEGHSGNLSSVAFSHDSALVASAAEDKTVRIWLADTGKCLHELKGHSKAVEFVAFSHDSALVVSASADMTIRIWRTKEGDCIRILEGHASSVSSIAISHNSAIIVSGSADESVCIWDANTGSCIHQLLGHDHNVLSVAISHDSALAASAAADGSIRIWSTENGACRSVSRSPQNWHPSCIIAFSPDSTLLVSAFQNDSIRFWRVDAGNCVRILELKTRSPGVRVLAFAPDWSLFVTTLYDEIHIWNTDTERCVQVFHYQIGYLYSATFSHDSKWIASASSDGTVCIWDAVAVLQKEIEEEINSSPALIHRRNRSVKQISFSYDSTLIASISGESNTIMIWSASTGDCMQQLACSDGSIESIVFSPDSMSLASFSYDPSISSTAIDNADIYIWRADVGICLRKFLIKIDHPSLSVFSHDLKLFAVGKQDKIELWSADRGIHTKTLVGDRIFSVITFSGGSAFISSGAYDGTISLWNTETGECIYTFYTVEAYVIDLVSSKDLTFVAAATNMPNWPESIVHIQHVNTNKRIQTLTVEGYIGSLAFSDDLSLIAAIGSSPDMLYVWEIETGKLIHTLEMWTVNSRPKFELHESRLLTDSGVFEIDAKGNDTVTTVNRWCGYGISPDGRWIMWKGHNLLRVPKEYETRKLIVREATVAIGYKPDSVVVLTMVTSELPAKGLLQ